MLATINNLSNLSNQNSTNLNNSTIVLWDSNFDLILGNVSLLTINNVVNQTDFEMQQTLQSMSREFTALVQLIRPSSNVTLLNLNWKLLGAQVQTLISTALRLLSIINSEADRLIRTFDILLFSLLGVVGFFAFFIYMQVFGSTLKSMEKFKKNEEKLEESNKSLENTVDVYSKQLKDAERMATIGQTAGMVGHDIRNPLQAITSDLYLLKEELKEVDQKKIKLAMQESIESMEENVFYIDKIVSDLQDYTRILKPQIEEVNVKEIINSIFIARNYGETIKIQIIVPDDLVLHTDATYLRRALSNLINNAVQAMPNGGMLIIQAYTDRGRAIISVKDTGSGISEETKANLFTPLFTTKAKGQGLGLAVVKRLTEALNGQVTVESEEGKGANFTIELPLT